MLERAVALASESQLQPIDLLLPQPEVDLLLDAEPDEPVGADPLAAQAAVAGESDDAHAAGAIPTSGLATSPAALRVEGGVPSDLGAYLDGIERDAIRAALARTGHNRTAAAQLLGLTFRQLRYRMQRLGLR